MFGITFETAILALRCNFSGIACDSLGYPPSSLLQLFRLFSDIKGVQNRAGVLHVKFIIPILYDVKDRTRELIVLITELTPTANLRSYVMQNRVKTKM